MSLVGERALFGLLREVDSLDALIERGFNPEFIPSADLRYIFRWAVKQYRESGRIKAPTSTMFDETEMEGEAGKSLGDILREHKIALDDVPAESVEWVMDDLKVSFLASKVTEWTRGFAEDVALAASDDKQRAVSEGATDLVRIVIQSEEKREIIGLRASAEEIIFDYETRKANVNSVNGLRFGMLEIDDHTSGIHDGELAIVGAGPKTGKSYMLARAALSEIQAGRSVALFTLENSIEMTRDRIACLATGVHPSSFERGTCTPDEEEAVREWVHELDAGNLGELWIAAPEQARRSAEHIVTDAQVRGVDSLIVDQLTFVTAPEPRSPRHIQIRDITHTFKAMISTGRNRMPCLMAHQINRDGMKTARKTGFLHMEDLAEGSEVERTADWAFGMYRSDDARIANQMLFQILACRRADVDAWTLDWDVTSGTMAVIDRAVLA